MNHETFLAASIGLVVGGLAAYATVILAGHFITSRSKTNDNDTYSNIIIKLTNSLNGTEHAIMLGEYIDILANIRTIFNFDYDVILHHIDAILDRDSDIETILLELENYMVALDLIQETSSSRI